MAASRADPYAVLRIANYRYFVLGRSFFTLAMQMQTVAVSWEIYQRLSAKTADAALALGLIGLVQVLPMMVLALPGGQAADRFDRRTIVRTTQLLFASCALAMLILSRSHAPVGYYYIVLAVAACGRAFTAPAIASLFPTLLPREILPNAAMWNSSIFQFSAMLGPALGGIIVAREGAATSYVVNIICASLAFLTFSLTTPVTAKSEKAPITWDSLLSGVRFVFGTRLLLGLFCLDLFAVLLGGATALLPIFANDLLKAGPQGYGLLRAAPSFGAVAGDRPFAALAQGGIGHAVRRGGFWIGHAAIRYLEAPLAVDGRTGAHRHVRQYQRGGAPDGHADDHAGCDARTGFRDYVSLH
jgi:MFS family permease